MLPGQWAVGWGCGGEPVRGARLTAQGLLVTEGLDAVAVRVGVPTAGETSWQRLVPDL